MAARASYRAGVINASIYYFWCGALAGLWSWAPRLGRLRPGSMHGGDPILRLLANACVQAACERPSQLFCDMVW